MSISALAGFRELLRESVAGLVVLSDDQAGLLEAHWRLMVRWNARLNLTAVTGAADAVKRHYGESLFVGAHLPAGTWRVADLGSGPGFPGIPIAVLRPDCEVTLVEANRRKAVFLSEAVREMQNVRVVAERLESLREPFDWVVSRAVSYQDLRRGLAKVGRRAALLTGAVSEGEMPGYLWEERLALPWGKQRFLWIGRSPELA
jgi:16S rRNA (guanine527-N7)-methyltransferase